MQIHPSLSQSKRNISTRIMWSQWRNSWFHSSSRTAKPSITPKTTRQLIGEGVLSNLFTIQWVEVPGLSSS